MLPSLDVVSSTTRNGFKRAVPIKFFFKKKASGPNRPMGHAGPGVRCERNQGLVSLDQALPGTAHYPCLFTELHSILSLSQNKEEERKKEKKKDRKKAGVFSRATKGPSKIGNGHVYALIHPLTLWNPKIHSKSNNFNTKSNKKKMSLKTIQLAPLPSLLFFVSFSSSSSFKFSASYDLFCLDEILPYAPI